MMFLVRRRSIVFVAGLGLAGIATAQTVPITPGVWTSGNMIAGNAGYRGNYNFASPPVISAGFSVVTGSASYTGDDQHGNLQQMFFLGETRNYASYSDLHSYSFASLDNAYFNASNQVLWDGTYHADGTPDSIAALGFAGFNNNYTFNGNVLPDETFQLVYEAHGTNSGYGSAADMAVNIGLQSDGSWQNSEGFFAFNPGSYNTVWATKHYAIDSSNPLSVGVFLSTQVVDNLNPTYGWPAPLPDGSHVSGTSDFGATAKFLGIVIEDANGNIVNDVTVSDSLGNTVTINPPVPEPNSMIVAGFGLMCFLRRKRKA